MTDVLTDVPSDTWARPLSTRRGVVRNLAGVEVRETLTHPLTAAGLLLSGALAYLYTGDALPILHGWDGLAPMFVAPLAAALAIVGHLAASRPLRDGTEALVVTAPATGDQRVRGVLVGVATSGALVSSVFVAVWVGWMAAIGGTGIPSVVELANGVAFAVLAGLAGASTGVWISARFAGLLVVAALAVAQAVVGGLPTARAAWLGWWRAPMVEAAAELQPRPAGWHLLWLAAVAVVLVGVGLLRHRRTAVRWSVPAFGVVLAAVTGAAMLTPLGAEDVERYVTLASDPPLDCRVDGPVEVCWLSPAYDRFAARWQTIAQATLEPVPDPPTVRIEQELFGLQAVARELDDPDARAAVLAHEDATVPQPPTRSQEAASPTADDIRILVRSTWSRPGAAEARFEHMGLALAVAQEATGLVAHSEGCVAAGQAREAVTLWLAAQASPAAAARLREEVRSAQGQADQVFLYSYAIVGGQTSEGVVWTQTGAELALAVLDHPDSARVHSLIADGWPRWIDPSTPARAVASPLGLHEPAATTAQQFPTCR